MLVITRRENESFTVGNAKVSIERIYRDKVRIGVDAPHDVPIARDDAKKGPREIGEQPASESTRKHARIAAGDACREDGVSELKEENARLRKVVDAAIAARQSFHNYFEPHDRTAAEDDQCAQVSRDLDAAYIRALTAYIAQANRGAA